MKRLTSTFLAVLLLLTCLLTGLPSAQAAKKTDSRTIAIAFDNSGSMYEKGNQAWCRATYAMEVFASMLNAGDTLLIYPMHAITVDGQKYTMESPLKITDAKQASKIREIYTDDAGGTPMRCVDCAIDGLKALPAGKKYLIVLTDGGSFDSLGKDGTVSALNKRVKENASAEMSIMYLGVGKSACMPTVADSEFFTKRKASDSKDVLSSLTEMCNLVFGRDTLPKNHIQNGKTIDFDISLSKLIVFVQGENISNLKVTDVTTGAPVGQLLGSQQTMYSTKGTGDKQYVKNMKWDDTLQGMMVTYTDCTAGRYNISFDGNDSNIEVYYEPDADLDFVFTDIDGNPVVPDDLQEGVYKVSFGMKDAKTGELIASDLLGTPEYQGSYSINGEETPITSTGYSGEEEVALNVDDTFRASLTTTFLSGYTITKTSTDFGWPEFGIKVKPRPAGDLKLEISKSTEPYYLQSLKSGAPFTAKVTYQGTPIVGEELEKVKLEWDPELSSALITKKNVGEYYELWLSHKDESAPQNTECGTFNLTITAHYTAPGSEEATAPCRMSYTIKDAETTLQLGLNPLTKYVLIPDLKNDPYVVVTANITLNGTPLTQEEFSRTKLSCDDMNCEIIPAPDQSAYAIRLKPGADISEGKYSVQATVTYTDPIGRTTPQSGETSLEFSNTPLWVKWAIRIGLLLLAIIIILLILNIKVYPKKLAKGACSMALGGVAQDGGVTYTFNRNKTLLQVCAKFGGMPYGIRMEVKPHLTYGKLKVPSKKRRMTVTPSSVKKIGLATVQTATIGAVSFNLDAANQLVPAMPGQKPFDIRNGTTFVISGVDSNGDSFTVNMQILFK